MSLYTASSDLSIPTSLDSSLETTAHQSEEGLQEGAGAAIYRHAYRTFGCKHCTAVHEYVALARCGDRMCPEGCVANFAQEVVKGQLPLSEGRLSGQGVEQFGRSEALVSGLHPHLSFLDHVHELNPH